MEARLKDLAAHVNSMSAALASACGIKATGPLLAVASANGLHTSSIGAAAAASGQEVRSVTTDLGNRETAIALPLEAASTRRLWIGLHEQWKYRTKTILTFKQCGIRVYSGAPTEEAIQLLRLEWFSPKEDDSGALLYDGRHAAHPHWHIDRSVLLSGSDAFALLDLLTRPPHGESGLETFDASLVDEPVEADEHTEFRWLTSLHLAAHASWMHLSWDGATLPGPHQCEPADLTALGNWWAGSLRYVARELFAHG